MSATPGPYRMGLYRGFVVTDAIIEGAGDGHNAPEFYGGNLIAESIFREDDARLLAASWTLLQAAKKVLAGLNARIAEADRRGDFLTFDGIADLHDTIRKAEEAPVKRCPHGNDPPDCIPCNF